MNACVSPVSVQDITEIKSFLQPPPAVRVVLEAVCLLLNEATDWENAKRVLGLPTFINSLVRFDKDNIPEKTLKKLARYITDPTMQVDAMRKVSVASTSLCMWVHAIDSYAKVFREVAPKRRRLEEMNTALETANTQLQTKQVCVWDEFGCVDVFRISITCWYCPGGIAPCVGSVGRGATPV